MLLGTFNVISSIDVSTYAAIGFTQELSLNYLTQKNSKSKQFLFQAPLTNVLYVLISFRHCILIDDIAKFSFVYPSVHMSSMFLTNQIVFDKKNKLTNKQTRLSDSKLASKIIVLFFIFSS